jgi:hypothetical protein
LGQQTRQRSCFGIIFQLATNDHTHLFLLVFRAMGHFVLPILLFVTATRSFVSPAAIGSSGEYKTNHFIPAVKYVATNEKSKM